MRMPRLIGSCVLGLATALASPATAQDEVGVGLIKLSGQLTERAGPFDWLVDSGTLTVRSVINAIDGAGENDEIGALVIQLEDSALTTTQIEELGAAMSRARDNGKQVYVVAESMGGGEVLLGSYADTVIGQAGSGLMFPGLYMEEWYLRDMLEWIGVEPSFVQVGAYKGADEMYNRSEPTGPWDKNISQLLDSIYGNLRAHITEGRNLSDAQLDTAMEKAWLATIDDGVDIGLVDEAIALQSLREYLEDDLNADVAWHQDLLSPDGATSFDPSNPFAVFAMLANEPSNEPDGPTIAVLHIDGAIMDGESSQGGMFGSASVGSRTIRRICDDLRKNDLIRGVVVRINSPGGSATASEVIWQAIREVADEKPVYVSVGSMAASGGYYIAVAGDRIFVNPTTIVGSIGVVGGKLAMDGLYEKLRVNVVGRARGPRANLFGSQPWTDDEKDLVRSHMRDTYDLFTERVTAGRPGINLSETAEGRLFTGDKAIGLRMADEIGSLTDAIEALAEEADLSSYDVLDYPGPQSVEDLLEQVMPFAASAPALSEHSALIAGLRAAVGPAWPEVKARLDAAIMLSQTPITLLEHRVLHFR